MQIFNILFTQWKNVDNKIECIEYNSLRMLLQEIVVTKITVPKSVESIAFYNCFT